MSDKPQRILDLASGTTMIVSDLRGDRDAFARHVGRFLQFRSRGKVERLLLLGDLIHSDGPDHEDASLQIVFDVMRMQNSLGPDAVITLLGNHEMPHLYGVALQRGNFEYTPRFEKALTASGRRDEVITFFDKLPFIVRTAGGVTFTHAGPDGNATAQMKELAEFDHQAILDEFTHVISINPNPDQLRNLYAEAQGMPYEVLARYYLAVEGPSDPRYDDLIRAFIIGQHSREYELLWDTLFTRCEKNMTMPFYERLLAKYLEAVSVNAAVRQQVLVTGHIDVTGGHVLVTPRHLRLASAAHAHPREAGEYLLLNAAQQVDSAEDLVPLLGSVYGS